MEECDLLVGRWCGESQHCQWWSRGGTWFEDIMSSEFLGGYWQCVVGCGEYTIVHCSGWVQLEPGALS